MAGEQIKEIVKIGGLNLRQEPADVEQNQLVQVTNLDPYRTPGTLTVRRGREMLYPIGLMANGIRQIAKVNGKRFQVAGRALYRDGTAITGNVLDTSLETNFVGFRPLNDSAIWAFVADDAIMLKDDGSNQPRRTGKDGPPFIWGIDLIPTPSPKVANQTGKISGDTITAGTYTIAVTQLRFDLNVTT